MQSYDLAHEGVVGIALDQKRLERFTNRAHRMIARRSAAAAKIMHRDVESLPARSLGRSYEQRIGKALDVWKLRAKKIEVIRARKFRRRVAVLNQGFNRDRAGSLRLFVERSALWRTRTSQDTAPVCRRR